MSRIQYSALTDDEFERAVYMAMGVAGALPNEVAKELAYRTLNGGRDKEREANKNNPDQLSLPLDN